MEQDPGPLADLRVGDLMSSPIRACAAGLPLPAVAELMAREHIHCVAVLAEDQVVGVISDLDLVQAASRDFAASTAAEAANEPLASVPVDATLATAAREMRDRRTHHLVVVDGRPPLPVGVLSTLDLVRQLGAAEPDPG